MGRGLAVGVLALALTGVVAGDVVRIATHDTGAGPPSVVGVGDLQESPTAAATPPTGPTATTGPTAPAPAAQTGTGSPVPADTSPAPAPAATASPTGSPAVTGRRVRLPEALLGLPKDHAQQVPGADGTTTTVYSDGRQAVIINAGPAGDHGPGSFSAALVGVRAALVADTRNVVETFAAQPPGRLGGEAACATGTRERVPTLFCAWLDEGTQGFVEILAFDDAAAALPRIRATVEQEH